jgi:uncharacterized protein
MCSPLALAVTGGGRQFVRKLLYNAGRILTYAIIGALFAGVGQAIDLSMLQFLLTVCVGSALIAMALSNVPSIRLHYVTVIFSKFSWAIKNAFGYFLQRKTHLSVFMLGMVNGLLPCGVTFLAFAYCVTLAGPLDGFNFMLWFGGATLPAMLGLTSLVSVIVRRYNASAARIARYSYLILGLAVFTRLYVTKHHQIDQAVNQVILFCQ